MWLPEFGSQKARGHLYWRHKEMDVAVESQMLHMAPHRIVEQVCGDLGLSTSDLARALGTSTRTLERWRSGETYPQHDMRRRLAALLELDRRLRETFRTPEAIHAWVHQPSRYLGGLTPADAIRVGRFDRVEADLEGLDSGVFL
jgi:transcriptional regulator with XRE-family HTH domain